MDVQPIDVKSQLEETVDWADETPTDDKLIRLRPLAQMLDQALKGPVHAVPGLDNKTIGSFQISRTLGSGGGGVVYLAVDPILGRQVAVKVPHRSALSDEDSRARFLQEAKLVSELRHANIVEIFQVGNAGNCPFLVFEYCAGGSLADWLAKQSLPLPPRLCAEIILTLARAAHHAHAQGILHRDVNPRNVLLVPLKGAETPLESSLFPFLAKLSDFGLATWLDEKRAAVQTQSGAVMGTLPYMAPEQTSSKSLPLQATVDVYALGVILYELLTRQRPFAGLTLIQTLRRIHETEPEPPRRLRPAIPRDLETICLKCLEKSATCRYLTAGHLADDLQLFLAGNPIRARRMSHFETAARWVVKRRLPIGIASLTTIAIMAVVVGGSWLMRELQKSRGSEYAFKRRVDENDAKLLQTQDNVKSLELDAQRRTARMRRHSNYIDQIRTIALLSSARKFEIIQMLRAWIPKDDESDVRGFEWYYLMQACGGDIAEMSRLHSNTVNTLRISADNQSVFVSYNSWIGAWDLKSGRGSEFVEFHNTVRDFTLSRTGPRMFAAINDGPYIEYLDFGPTSTRDRFPIREPAPFRSQRVLFLPDEREFISICRPSLSGQAPSAIFWHDATAKTDAVLDSITWSDGRVFDAVVDPADQSLIVAVNDSIEVYVKGLNSGKASAHVKSQKCQLAGHGRILSLAISADGGMLAASTEQGTVMLCRKDSKRDWTLRESFRSVSNASELSDDQLATIRYPVRFNRQGTRLFVVIPTGLSLLDVSREQGLRELGHVEFGTVRGLEVLPDGETVVWLSEIALGQWHPIPELPPIQGHLIEAWSVAFSPDGKSLATGSDDHSIRIWNLERNELQAELTGHVATVTQIAYSQDGKWLASASLDGTAKIWNTSTHQLKSTLSDHAGAVRALAWFPDGGRLATSDSPPNDEPKQMIVWDVEKAAPVQSFSGFKDRIPEILITQDAQSLIGVSDDGTAGVWKLDEVQPVWTAREDVGIRCAVLIDDERLLATGNNNGVITLRDLRGGKVVGELRGHTGQVLSLAVSPDGRALASAGLDQMICLWDLETSRLLLTLDGQTSQINDLAFSPSGEILAAALHDGSIKLLYAPRFTPLQFQR